MQKDTEECSRHDMADRSKRAGGGSRYDCSTDGSSDGTLPMLCYHYAMLKASGCGAMVLWLILYEYILRLICYC